ncbi:MAG: hypothetical protein M3Z18_10505 [Gemmatimonadota bacterium]|nr:hypothetical protein [Gemmatimonadota bacterium]
MRVISMVSLVAAIFLSCAPPASIERPARNPNVITKDEILVSHVFNAYEAVNMLRPNFLRSHGPTSISGGDSGYPKVYLNHILYGNVESLRGLDVSSIREIRYYNGAEASSRFGLNNVSGAIEVITDAGQ